MLIGDVVVTTVLVCRAFVVCVGAVDVSGAVVKAESPIVVNALGSLPNVQDVKLARARVASTAVNISPLSLLKNSLSFIWDILSGKVLNTDELASVSYNSEIYPLF